ncbi:MAG TPA: peptide-methionine (S)-S-oxide reductase MsrA [Hyphomicrobiaceae bacterium]|nr:peptide-methionine (S)-S-oxide reductase MsrA [Hyphomicrobiaceae bacterium]
MLRRFAAALAVLVAMAAIYPVPAQQSPAPQPAAGQKLATFAGGCFWCMEHPFDKLDGVIATTSGFMGGTLANPTYKQVVNGGTGHKEVVQVIYDPSKVSYERLLEVYWMNVDPYDAEGQFCDRGDMYGTAIFAHDAEQQRLAEAAKAKLAKSGPIKQPIVTEVRAAGPFTAAEDYHQDYYKKNPIRYGYYRAGCGRDARLLAIWGKAPS